MNNSKIKNLKDLLSESTTLYHDRTLMSFVNGVPMTYGEFAIKVDAIQKMIIGLGIQQGDKIALFSHNMPNYGVAYFAATSMGAIVVPMLPDFSPTEAENIINHSEAKIIFVSERLKMKLANISTPNLQTSISMDDFCLISNTAASTTTLFDVQQVVIDAEDIASIVYTSGTTGKSKGVMLTHHNLISQIKMLMVIQPIKPEDIFFSILPLPHLYEGSLGLLLPILGGASICYLEKPPTASVLLPALKKIRPTYMLSVPMIIEKIYRNSVLPKINDKWITRILYKTRIGKKLIHKSAGKKLYETFGGRLVFFGIGGAKLDPVVEQFLYDGKFPYAIGYGLTETAPVLSAAVPSNVLPKSAGYFMGGIEFKINDPKKTTGEGELWVKSPCTMKGYFKEPELTKEVITQDGWFRTGDLVTLSKNNRLFIRGRLKNVIIGSSGENIYPEEIESVINNYPYVLESLVIEQKGRLVAMVKFNYEEFEKHYQQLKEELLSSVEAKKAEVEQKMEQLKLDLMLDVNSKVSRFSQISMVIALSGEFEKTSTMKIKRYLYS